MTAPAVEPLGKIAALSGGRSALAVAVALLLVAVSDASAQETAKSGQSEGESRIVITIVYDNNGRDERLRTAWGFACVVEGLSETILFDTGAGGQLLLDNMGKSGFKPGQIDHVVLSHIHGDHTGGLEGFLRANSDVTVFLPRIFPSALKERVRSLGAKVVETEGPQAVCDGATTTGVLRRAVSEQALCVRTPKGPVVITGCAHPGVANLLHAAKEHSGSPINEVLGGFHMGSASDRQIDAVIKELRQAGIQQVAPCHCSGDRARDRTKKAFGEGDLPSGVGARLVFDRQEEDQR
jgi:7,8-dihydropterin-6-yl-methyl-4-(beta-D-ribofuranosyl)aminobenzene 5'-phosphate synthase